jgi:hypothetical protein
VRRRERVNSQPTRERQFDVLVAGVGDCGSSILVILRKLTTSLQPEGFVIQPWFVDYTNGEISLGERIEQIVRSIGEKKSTSASSTPISSTPRN